MVGHSQSQAPDWFDDPSLARAHGLTAIRDQVAVVRTLTDELERVVPSSWAEHPISEQLIEEMTCLGHRILEIASALAGAAERQSSLVPPHCDEGGGQVPVS